MDEAALKPGDYGCVSLSGFFAWCIKKFTYPRGYKGKRYNHAFIYLGDGMIAEAQPRGAKISPLSKYNGHEMIFNTNDAMTDEQRSGVCIAAKTLAAVGIRYGFLDIAWLGMYAIGIRWNWLLHEVRKEAREICSQMVAFCGQENGVDSWLCGKRYAQEVTPMELAWRCTESKVIGQ